MPEVSIIVPVYKVEPYLRRCVDSILAQTFQDFELILVDDGSPDHSGAICDEYAAFDSRISVVHTQNKGASAARNTGLSLAKGKYIMFCDSDDAVSPMWIERLYHYVHADESVLPIGAYCSAVSNLGTSVKRTVSNNVMYDSSQYFLFMQAGLAGYLWNALYSGDIIEKHCLRFRTDKLKGDFNEDLLFALEYVRHVKHIVFTGFADYCYLTRDGSLSRSYQGYYFEKYKEKYDLWKQNIMASNLPETDVNLSSLATMMLPHFIVALSQEGKRLSARTSVSCYHNIRNIVLAPTVQDCLCYADTSNENPLIIRLMKAKKSMTLWIFYILYKLKGRITE